MLRHALLVCVLLLAGCEKLQSLRSDPEEITRLEQTRRKLERQLIDLKVIAGSLPKMKREKDQLEARIAEGAAAIPEPSKIEGEVPLASGIDSGRLLAQPRDAVELSGSKPALALTALRSWEPAASYALQTLEVSSSSWRAVVVPRELPPSRQAKESDKRWSSPRERIPEQGGSSERAKQLRAQIEALQTEVSALDRVIGEVKGIAREVQDLSRRLETLRALELGAFHHGPGIAEALFGGAAPLFESWSFTVGAASIKVVGKLASGRSADEVRARLPDLAITELEEKDGQVAFEAAIREQ